eukprot:244769_1
MSVTRLRENTMNTEHVGSMLVHYGLFEANGSELVETPNVTIEFPFAYNLSDCKLPLSSDKKCQGRCARWSTARGVWVSDNVTTTTASHSAFTVANITCSSTYKTGTFVVVAEQAHTYKVLNRVDGIWTDDQSNSKDETIGHLLDSILPLQRNRLYAHRGRSLSLPIILPSARQTLDSIEEDSQLYTESNTESSEGVYRVLHEYLGRNPEDSNVVPVPVPTVVDAKKTNVYRTPADQNEQIYNVRSNIYSTLNE